MTLRPQVILAMLLLTSLSGLAVFFLPDVAEKIILISIGGIIAMANSILDKTGGS